MEGQADDGSQSWNQAEKFYDAEYAYLIRTFLCPCASPDSPPTPPP